ncbi:MAG: hypothetical protein R3C53_03085 [Pirellulaceae bacterium]
MAKKLVDLPFDLTGCKVNNLEWPKGGLCLILGGSTAARQNVEGSRVTFERVSNLEPVHTFLMASLKYVPAKQGRMAEYRYGSKPIRLPARLTQLSAGRPARISYADKVFTKYYGAPRATSSEHVFHLALAAPRFRDRPAFPIVCRSVAFIANEGNAVDHLATSVASPLPLDTLEPLARKFAEAILKDDAELANSLLTPAAQKRLARSGLKKWLPRGWKDAIRELGSPEAAIAATLKHLTVEPPLEDDIEGVSVRDLAPDLPFESVRGQLMVFPGDPEWDIDEMFSLHFVEVNGEPRIGFVS